MVIRPDPPTSPDPLADRLAAIEEHLTDHQDIHEDDGWWLLGKLKRLREDQIKLQRYRSLGQIPRLDLLLADNDRLRGLIARLEWAGTYCDRGREMAACPVCDVVADSPIVGQQPHAADCWLAKELGR